MSAVAEPAAEAVDLDSALRQLCAYAVAQLGRHATLGALLVRADQLPPELRHLAIRIMRAIPTSGGWLLTEGAFSAEPGEALQDRVVTALSEATDPLTDAQVLERVPEAGDLKTVRSLLFADDRVMMADTGGWTLAGNEREGGEELQLFALPAAGASPTPSRQRQRRSLKDRVQLCLRDASHPLSLQALVERLGDDVNESSLKQVLSTEASFMRSDISEWALTHWGLRPYTSVRELIGEELDEAGGAIAMEVLERNLGRHFTIKPSTLRQVASTSPYYTSSGIVRRLVVGQSAGQHESNMTRTYGTGGNKAAAQEESAPSAEELIDLMGLL
ncbi:hypothetical protein [Streptomyces aidingensis]|nr:hypothetical protein [Streptomyces aidingensis]